MRHFPFFIALVIGLLGPKLPRRLGIVIFTLSRKFKARKFVSKHYRNESFSQSLFLTGVSISKHYF